MWLILLEESHLIRLWPLLNEEEDEKILYLWVFEIFEMVGSQLQDDFNNFILFMSMLRFRFKITIIAIICHLRVSNNNYIFID